MKTLFELELQKRRDFRLKIADEKQSLADWQRGENDEGLEDAYLATQLGERLGVLLEFFASAETERGVAMRVWCGQRRSVSSRVLPHNSGLLSVPQ